jgi:Glycine rich protein
LTTTNFAYTGALQTFTVPSDVTSIDVVVKGAQGGNGFYQPTTITILGGQGCTVTGTISVIPNEILSIYVGGQPGNQVAGYNGGGNGVTNGTGTWGGGGGGASDIRRGSTLAGRLVVAGGGGGSTTNTGVIGGTGGLNGGLGGGTNGGSGGTQTAGGAGGTAGSQTVGSPGVLGIGGDSGIGSGNLRPGGGGGGYYGGGGGGGTNTGSGGGGSSLVPAGGSATTGGVTGNGSVSLTYVGNPPPVVETQPNYRNAVGTQCPPLMTSMDGLVQFGVCIDGDYSLTAIQRNVYTGAMTTNDMNANAAAISSGLVPLNATEDSNASHYAYAGARDDRDRNYIVGNSLASVPHMLRSAANSITSWVNIPWPYPGMADTGGGSTYQIFNRLSTGELIFHIDQRPSAGEARGKDNYAFILPLGSDTWQPLISGQTPVGMFASAALSAPDRVYLTGCFVEYFPHRDRVWVSGVWRDDWTQVTTQRRPWLIYNDTVTNSATWKAYDGSPQTMPLTSANCGYATETGATVPQTHGTYCPYQSGQLVVDWKGWPHMLMKVDSTTTTWHYWWNGSVWNSEQCATQSYPNIALKPDGQIAMYREFANRIQFNPVTGSAYTFTCGNAVPGNFDFPFADPIQQQRYGYTHLMIPDAFGNPEVCTFGDAVRIST